MDDLDKIRLEKIDKNSGDSTRIFEVTSEQAPYVCANVKKFMNDWATASKLDCYFIHFNENEIGFFALDFAHDRHAKYVTEETDFAVLRNFLIDKNFQGRGLAKKSMNKIDQLISDHYPRVKSLYLTVNFKNEVAVKAYTRCGFSFLKEPYLGGAAGPQHVLFKKI
jgi:ribosomal protein S18 acetylase RimI-like enzyme